MGEMEMWREIGEEIEVETRVMKERWRGDVWEETER
jgi:hypothetical protein